MRASFVASDRTYGARRVWHDVLAEGVSCGLHRIERLMRAQVLRARPRRRRRRSDLGERPDAAVAPNVLDRSFEASAPNRKWIANFTYIWTAEGWLYVAAARASANTASGIGLFGLTRMATTAAFGTSSCKSPGCFAPS